MLARLVTPVRVLFALGLDRFKAVLGFRIVILVVRGRRAFVTTEWLGVLLVVFHHGLLALRLLHSSDIENSVVGIGGHRLLLIA